MHHARFTYGSWVHGNKKALLQLVFHNEAALRKEFPDDLTPFSHLLVVVVVAYPEQLAPLHFFRVEMSVRLAVLC